MLQIYEVSLGLHAAERGSPRLTALAPGSDGLVANSEKLGDWRQ